jgi:CDP-glycerol glycerophosphotransferase
MLRGAGLPTILFPEIESLETLARASTIVVDTFDFKNSLYAPLTNYARIIQLWHGVGFKKIGLVEKDSAVPQNYESKHLESLYSGYHTVVSTSQFYCEEVFGKSFRAEHFVDLGYPRNDALFYRPTKDSMLNCDNDAFQQVASIRKQRKTILYAPTFRDHEGSPFGGGLDFERLHNFLDEEGLHLIIKTHRLTDLQISSSTPHITIYANDRDAYPFFQMIDVMITDYSSIYMDYLLLDRPVVFYCPDYDHYVTHNREFQFPYEEMTPGPKCRSQEDLHTALKLAAFGDDGYQKERKALLNKAFSYQDGNSSKRIADYLCK